MTTKTLYTIIDRSEGMLVELLFKMNEQYGGLIYFDKDTKEYEGIDKIYHEKMSKLPRLTPDIVEIIKRTIYYSIKRDAYISLHVVMIDFSKLISDDVICRYVPKNLISQFNAVLESHLPISLQKSYVLHEWLSKRQRKILIERKIIDDGFQVTVDAVKIL